MSSAFSAANFNRIDMTETRRIDQVHTNGKTRTQNDNVTSVVTRVPTRAQRRIDCCQRQGDELDSATRVGDGYKRVAQ